MCAHADKKTYGFDRSVDWQVCPVDIRLSQGVFRKVLHVERASGESVDMEVALGIDTGSNYARTVDRNLHIDLLNSKSYASHVEVVDADLDLRKMTRLSPDECEPFLSGDAARRVGLWALNVGCEEVLLDAVTLLENFLAIDSFTACLLLSPLMSPGYEVSISASQFLFRADSGAIGDFFDLGAPHYPVSQFHRARCLAYWLGCVATDEVLQACRSSVITHSEPIHLPVVPHALPARLTCCRAGDRLLVAHVQPMLYGGAWPRRFDRIRLEDERTGVGMDFWQSPSGQERQSLPWWGPSGAVFGDVTCRSYPIPGLVQNRVGTAFLARLDPVREFAPTSLPPNWTYTDIVLRERILAWQCLDERKSDASDSPDALLQPYERHRAQVRELLEGVSDSRLHKQIPLYIEAADIHFQEAQKTLERCTCQVDDVQRSAFRSALQRVGGLLEREAGAPGIEALEQAFLEAFVIDEFLALSYPHRPGMAAASNNRASGEFSRLRPALIDAMRSLLRSLTVTELFANNSWPLMRLAVFAKLLGATSMSPADVRDCLARTGPYMTNVDLHHVLVEVFGESERLLDAATHRA